MKYTVLLLCVLFSICSVPANAQTNWKLSRNKDGIAVFTREVPGTAFKSIRVECTFEGTYQKLISIINNVSNHKNWIYSNKTAYMLKAVSPYEYYYYTETSLPWPVSNRDAIMHARITIDSLNRFMKVVSVAEPKYAPEKDGKVRVLRSDVMWYVTMPTNHTIKIIYTMDTDPGGSVPAWLVNSFIDKGPYESFKKLETLLKK